MCSRVVSLTLISPLCSAFLLLILSRSSFLTAVGVWTSHGELPAILRSSLLLSKFIKDDDDEGLLNMLSKTLGQSMDGLQVDNDKPEVEVDAVAPEK